MKKFSQYTNSKEDCGCNQVQEASGFMGGIKSNLPDVRKGEFSTAAGGVVGGLASNLLKTSLTVGLGKGASALADKAKTSIDDKRGVKKIQGGCARHVDDLKDMHDTKQDEISRKPTASPSDQRQLLMYKLRWKKAHADCAKKMKADTLHAIHKQEDEIEDQDISKFLDPSSAPPP